MNKTCERCRFYRPPGLHGIMGRCRKEPPRATKESEVAVWPKVLPNDWCGCFNWGTIKPRAEEP